MLNPFHEINWKPDRKAQRTFARSLMIGFPVVALVLAVMTRLGAHEWKPVFVWLGAIGFGIGLFCWLLPGLARPFYLVWYALAGVMGLVMGNLLLGLVYYGVLTPIGLVLRLLNRCPLRKGFDRDRASYWEDAREITDPQRYYRQF